MADVIYLQLAGIDGAVVERGHEGWIELTSVTWGVEQSGAQGPGGGAGRPGRAGRSAQHPLTVTAPTSIATPLLFEAVVTGLHVPSAKLEVVRAADGRGQVAARWEFEEVRLTRLDVSGAPDGFDDVLELVAMRVRLSVSEADPRGGAAQTVTRGWDFAAHQAW